ncbi:MAG: protein kinase [Polyangiaceae bacterium]|nr:protein kinase [Polyangiaceae bacterium]
MGIREIRELGRGSFGRVYLAHDDELGMEVAIKELHEPNMELERFRREAAILAEQSHNPYIVDIYRYDLDAPKPYLVLGVLRRWVTAQMDRQGHMATSCDGAHACSKRPCGNPQRRRVPSRYQT